MKPSRRQPKRAAPASGRTSALREGSTAPLQFCFFASGTAGLMLQVVWTKMLGQLFGSSAYAVATVLAVFMGGLALGSAVFGRWRPAAGGGVRLYAWMEWGIAATALASLAGIPLVGELYVTSHPYLQGSVFALLALRFAGAAVVLLLPTFLMGGTLPVVLAAVVRTADQAGIRAGRFYAVNTAGAVVGTLAAGFWLIPSIGLRLTLFVAVVLDLAAGALAWSVSRSLEAVPVDGPGEAAAERESSESFHLACFALVGGSAIAYEIGWTRLLATPLGSSTYAFSLMLAAFLLGISIGSFLYEAWFRRTRIATSGLFAVLQLAIGAGVLASLWLYREIPELVLTLLRRGGGEFPGLLAAQAAACGLAILPATILFGFNFPAVLTLVSGGRAGDELRLRARVGRAVAANTAGAILAALVSGFLLLPWMGSFRLVAAAAALNACVGLALFLKNKGAKAVPLLAAAALIGGILWTAGSRRFFSQSVGAFGVVLYRDFHNSHLTAREMAATEDVTYFADGINSTIAVTRSEDYVALKTNGKVDASNLDASTQLLLGDLGAVFHPDPKRVLIVGFGGGMTASAVSRFPEVERIDCVEIEPAVVGAASGLERLHRGVVRDPRLHLYYDDARNFLLTSRERYDLIISEPSNPWIAGIASLYTTEFFLQASRHLAPGGSFVQWIQAYGLSGDDFAMVLASMQPHFRDMTLWHSAGRDFLVLARDSPAPLGFDRARALWENTLLREDFLALHLAGPEGWPAYFRLASPDLARLARGSSAHHDDRTRLEYAAPRHLLRPSLTAELEDRVRSAEAEPLRSTFPAEPPATLALASAATAIETEPDRAERFLAAVPDTNPQALVLRARVKLRRGDAATAAGELERLPSNQYDAGYWLALAEQRQGLLAAASSTLEGFLRSKPGSEDGLRSKAEIASALKDWPAAVEAQTRLIAERPDDAREQCRLGDLLLRSRRIAEAEAPLRGGLRLDPYAFLCHRELGELERATGRTSDAIRELEWVVRYFPEADAKTYVSLALARQTAGDREGAEAALAKGRRLFPADPLLGEFRLR